MCSYARIISPFRQDTHMPLNSHQQPIGEALPDWTARPRPSHKVIEGRSCRLEPLDVAQHAEALFNAYCLLADGSDWTYLPVGPFTDLAAYTQHLQTAAASQDPQHWAVIDLRSGTAVGTLSLMRMDPANGVIEVGHVTFSPLMKRTPVSTEAQFLLMKFVFDELGYRRYEWKCDALNAPSRKAADRLGFSFEGIFRQALVYKGRNRDTAWYSIIDQEWPALRTAFERWLAADNFDAQGVQKASLTDLRQPR